MKKIITISLMLFAGIIYSQITLIPDPEFEEALILQGIDSDGIVNGQVLTSDIENITTFHLLGNPSITDLTGIEDFVNLEFLDINSVNITEINLSENLNLNRLDIWDVSLNSLDISNNIALEQFQLSLNSSSGFFTSDINTLNLSANTLLDRINISGVNLSFLDFLNNINITYLVLHSMESLNDINLKNGNNELILFLQIFNNQNLQCVQVDNPEAVIAGTVPPYDNWVIENNPIITDDCNLGIEENLISIINVYPNPVKERLYILNTENIKIEKITIYDILGKVVLIEKNSFNKLNLSDLNSGILLVKIKTERGTITKKIIKE